MSTILERALLVGALLNAANVYLLVGVGLSRLSFAVMLVCALAWVLLAGRRPLASSPPAGTPCERVPLCDHCRHEAHPADVGSRCDECLAAAETPGLAGAVHIGTVRWHLVSLDPDQEGGP